MKKSVLIMAGLLSLLISCRKLGPGLPPADEVLEGPVEGLSTEENARFIRGDAAFNAAFTPENGLGPIFVASSCAGCHAGDGKGHPFSTLTRFGQTDSNGNTFLTHGGPQLQNRAIPGHLPEQLPAGATSAKFTPPANTGLGYLEAVSDADLLAMSDPYDANGDGISGVPNWENIPGYLSPKPGAITRNGKYICRFGKKSGAYNLLHQTVNAYVQDMGVNTVYYPIDLLTGQAVAPEVSTSHVEDLVFYLRTLKAPIQRDQDKPEVVRGKQTFASIGCASCHKETLHTGASSIPVLENKEFHPYTDLLLHDMGQGLDDGYTEGMALTSEWRTPALWGLGLSKQSQGGSYFLLHDGRATSIEQAIILHGGESTVSRQKFEALSADQKKELIAFLESL